MKKLPVYAASLLALMCLRGRADTVTIDLTVGQLLTSGSLPIPDGSLVEVLADTSGTFGAPTASSFEGTDTNEVLVSKFVMDSTTTGSAGDFSEPVSITLSGSGTSEGPGSYLVIRWFPTLTTSSATPGVGTSYGQYSTLAIEYPSDPSSIAWQIPSAGSYDLFFLTQSQSALGPGTANNPPANSAGVANLITYAVSTWLANPGSGDWNTAANWDVGTVPTGPLAVATFGLSSTTAVSLSGSTQVYSIVFNSNATNPYTITVKPAVSLAIAGAGISNVSGTTQNFVTAVNGSGQAGSIVFSGSASAGSLIQITNNGSTVSGSSGGATIFSGSSSAGSAILISNGGTGGGLGGATYFTGASNGGTAQAITNGNGIFDISGLTNGGMAIGSIQGSGTFFLGGNTLTVGGNNLSTTVSGGIANGGASGGAGGAIVKTGTGTLILAGSSSYTGSTTVSSGVLQLGNGTTDGNIASSSNIVDNAALVYDRVGTFRYGGIISGSGTVTITGPGSQALTAVNNYSGGTFIIGGGSLIAGADANLGNTSGGIAINSGGMLSSTASFITNRNISLGSVLPGAGGAPGTSIAAAAQADDGTYPTAIFNVAGGTELTLNGVITGDSNSRLEIVSGTDGRASGGNGILFLDNTAGTNSFGSIYLHGTGVAGNNLLVLTPPEAQFGNAPVTQDYGATLISDQSNVFSAQFQIGSGGAVRETNAGNAVFRTGPIVNAAEGPGGLIFQGDETQGSSAGTLGLGGSNTFGGLGYAVTVNGNSIPGVGNATLSISADGNLGNSANRLVLNGATLAIEDGINNNGVTNTPVQATFATSRPVFLSGTSTIYVSNTHNAELNSFSFTSLGVHTNTFTINGAISDGTAAGTLNMTGPGTLVLAGANSYSGGTEINGGGTLVAGSDQNLGNTSVLAGISINNGSTLSAAATFSTSRAISLGSLLPGAPGAPGTSAVGSTIQPDGTQVSAIINAAAGAILTLNGPILGDSNSRLMITGGNGVSGGNGEVFLNNTGGTANSFGSLYLHGSGVSGENLLVKTAAVAQFGNAPITQDGGSALISDQSGAFSASFLIGAGGAIRETDSGHAVFRTGPIANVDNANNAGGLIFQGDQTEGGSAGTLGLGGSNSFGSTTAHAYAVTVNSGATLSISSDANLGKSGNDLDLNGGILAIEDGANVSAGGTSAVLASFSTSRQINLNGGGTINVTNTYDPAFNDGGSYASYLPYLTTLEGTKVSPDVFTVNGSVAGTGGLNVNQTGAGTLVFDGSSSYSGPTNVEGGQFVVAGTVSGSTMKVFAGATLSSGPVGTASLIAPTATSSNAVVVSGTLSPGGIGTVAPINISLQPGGQLNFQNGSTLLFDLGASGSSDVVNFTGTAGNTLAESGAVTLALNGTLASGTYTVFQNVTTSGFTFSSITGYNPAIDSAVFSQSGNNYDLTIQAVPEPGAWALISSGIAMLGFRRRLRRPQCGKG